MLNQKHTHKEDRRAKKDNEGEVGGHTKSEKETERKAGERERIARSERKPGYKVERGGGFTEREHRVTERSNRHSGFDISSASD